MKKEDEGKDNSFGVASFVLGLLSVLLFFTVVPSLVMGVLGIIFAVIQKKKSNNKWVLWGMILSIAGLAIGIIALIAIVGVLSSISDMLQLIQQCQADPTLPGCEEIAAALQQQSAGVY